MWLYEHDVYQEQDKQIGRWMGVAHKVGQEMCYWILLNSGVNNARNTIREISINELE